MIFAQIKECDEANIENIGKEHDAEMGEKSCQPFGLRPKSRLTASAASTVFPIRSSASSLSSTILARNAHALHCVRNS